MFEKSEKIPTLLHTYDHLALHTMTKDFFCIFEEIATQSLVHHLSHVTRITSVRLRYLAYILDNIRSKIVSNV